MSEVAAQQPDPDFTDARPASRGWVIRRDDALEKAIAMIVGRLRARIADVETTFAEIVAGLEAEIVALRARTDPKPQAEAVPNQADEALHPETRSTSKGGDGRHAETRRQIGDECVERFTADTAAKTGQSERVVQRDADGNQE